MHNNSRPNSRKDQAFTQMTCNKSERGKGTRERKKRKREEINSRKVRKIANTKNTIYAIITIKHCFHRLFFFSVAAIQLNKSEMRCTQREIIFYFTRTMQWFEACFFFPYMCAFHSVDRVVMIIYIHVEIRFDGKFGFVSICVYFERKRRRMKKKKANWRHVIYILLYGLCVHRLSLTNAW